jgi:TonB family protein
MALQARSHARGETLTPIDLVELPDQSIAAAAHATAPSTQAKPAASSLQTIHPLSIPASVPDSEPARITAPSNPTAAQLLPAPSSAVPKFSQANVHSAHSAAKPIHPISTAERKLPEPAAVASPHVNPTSSPARSSPATNTETANTEIATRLPSQDIPTPTPAITPTPLIATQPIDVPVPDVSGTLPVSESPTPSGVTGQVIIPSRLVANLTTEPIQQNNPLIDEVAHPKTAMQTFSSNPVASPCAVKPEAVQVLGETVAMEVMTDAKGKVINTVMQQSSQNPAYDELATCLVKHWSFEPAIAQSEPVANDGLVVRITIDRGS